MEKPQCLYKKGKQVSKSFMVDLLACIKLDSFHPDGMNIVALNF